MSPKLNFTGVFGEGKDSVVSISRRKVFLFQHKVSELARFNCAPCLDQEDNLVQANAECKDEPYQKDEDAGREYA